MLICEFCTQRKADGECRLGLRIPKRMSCRDFDPSVDRFCSNPADFVNEAQLNGLDWGAMFAGVCVVLAPMIALFSWLGTRIIQGMTVGIGK